MEHSRYCTGFVEKPQFTAEGLQIPPVCSVDTKEIQEKFKRKYGVHIRLHGFNEDGTPKEMEPCHGQCIK